MTSQWFEGNYNPFNWLPNDVARCPGYQADGEWREGCEDCLRRTAPIDPVGRTPIFVSPFPAEHRECEYRIAP